MKNKISATVKEYYGKVLKTKKDLKTSACCATDTYPPHLRELIREIPQEVLDKSYGCGLPIPPLLDGKTILDLGCGAGRDIFILSRLVGPGGHVIGVDMTPEQLSVARRHLSAKNITLLEGYMEDLESLKIANDSIDAVISNCVINLSPDKAKVFSEIFHVLKPGGEFYFSDVFASRRIPANLATDPVLLGECLGGALYIEDFRRLLFEIGCKDYRVVTNTKLQIQSPEVLEKTGVIDFYSMTIRAFKLKLEDRCEDYGQIATYLAVC